VDAQLTSRFATVAAAAIIVLASVAAAAQDLSIADSAGAPLRWNAWVEEHAPVVVVLWAAWAPGADDTIAVMGEITRVARSRGYEAVLVSVQEDVAEARAALVDAELPWLHDRYGALLKHYRVVEIPSAVILGSDGEARGLVKATPMALREWSRW